ncbi:MAG: zinc-dependent peptidase [Candidatus Bipolaricaulota bacterium]|nr:zinc-dependent peptidase [Candidatus Bipolaricaulota bacterium]MDW8126923.1 zinc-dependent peptidase [Candidatus Bipolaricaulota bacterium]
MSFLRRWRRERLRAKPFPKTWELLLPGIPLFSSLPPQDQHELRAHIRVFLAEKRFEGATGFQVDERVRVTIAGNACLLLLHRETEYFPFLRTVVVYPTLYVARYMRSAPGGAVEEGMEVRAGESWPLGTVVLAWDAVSQAGFGQGARNVVVHEFAHQLDLEDGAMQGVPVLPPELVQPWKEIFFGEYQKLGSFPDPSPLVLCQENPAEFFATAVELFFSDPWTLRMYHPALYKLFTRFFLLDPAANLHSS